MSIMLHFWVVFSSSKKRKIFLEKSYAGSQRGQVQGMFGEHQSNVPRVRYDEDSTGTIDRGQNVEEIECQAKEFIFYSLNNGDSGKSFEKENDTFRFM